jgi:hypothetical protein
MKASILPIVVAGLALASPSPAETVADRKGAVLQDRSELADSQRWIYDDAERGFAEAERAGKPLLVVLRCIPCLACAGIDSAVLLEDSDLAPLLDEFVCLRLINANSLDLTRFQFDYDLSFSVLVFNGDGTLYARYGSWAHQKDPHEKTTEGFRGTLEAALDLHRGYPANREALAGKQGRPLAYKTPLDMPTIEGKYARELDWDGQVVQSCVHCHQVGDALRFSYRDGRQRIPASLIYPFPAPETLGVALDPGQAAQVKSVEAGSAAARAGIQPGDTVERLDGQPLASGADFSWALHTAPDEGSLSAAVRRGDSVREIQLPLDAGWRRRSDISRRVGTWPMRAMALGGMVLEDLPDAERREHRIEPDRLALRAKHVGEYGEHAAAKNAGFRKDDIVVAIDGITARTGEGELIGELLERHQRGAKVSATILRGDQKLELELPMQ